MHGFVANRDEEFTVSRNGLFSGRVGKRIAKRTERRSNDGLLIKKPRQTKGSDEACVGCYYMAPAFQVRRNFFRRVAKPRPAKPARPRMSVEGSGTATTWLFTM